MTSNASERSKIILFGGTFDPIHNGHLHIASLAQKAIQADKLSFIPCKIPVHKQTARASAHARYDMIKAALSAHSTYTVDDLELTRDSDSYSVTTLEHYKAQYPHADLYWLMGTDSYSQFKRWHEWRTILTLCHLVVVKRPHVEIKHYPDLQVRTSYSPDTFDGQTGRILTLDVTGVEISSTDVRAQFWLDEESRHKVPEKVKNYILTHNLYNDIDTNRL